MSDSDQQSPGSTDAQQNRAHCRHFIARDDSRWTSRPDSVDVAPSIAGSRGASGFSTRYSRYRCSASALLHTSQQHACHVQTMPLQYGCSCMHCRRLTRDGGGWCRRPGSRPQIHQVLRHCPRSVAQQVANGGAVLLILMQQDNKYQVCQICKYQI